MWRIVKVTVPIPGYLLAIVQWEESLSALNVTKSSKVRAATVVFTQLAFLKYLLKATSKHCCNVSP